MKKIILYTLLFLTSCAPAVPIAVVQPIPDTTQTSFATTLPKATATLTPPSVFPSSTVTQATCDPFSEDFCITDGHFILQNPIFSPDNTFVDITYRYGSTQNGAREPHHGVEFSNRSGTPIHAAGDGVVQFAGPDIEAVYSPWRDFYGNVVVIRHANELYTLYAHLSRINVKAGDGVKAGDLIGEVGQSGVAIGSHLHFEVRMGGDGTNYFSTQNPEVLLIPNRDENGEPLGAISFSVVDQNSQFQFVEFTARYYREKNGEKIKSHYIVTYPLDMALGEENAALGDLPPGYYYVALKSNGQIFERWVEVQSGKLTQVVLVVK